MLEEMTESVDSTPLWQQVAGLVRRSIQAGRLRPGDRVVEAQLARRYGISRNPIREALRQLQQQGILEYRPNVGTLVAGVSAEDAQLATEMRAFLEQQAADLLLGGTDAEMRLTELEGIVARMADLPEDAPLADLEMLDAEFHQMLIEASGSMLLRRVWANVDPYTWMILMVWQNRPAGYHLSRQRLYEDHRRLMDALHTGDVGALREHILRPMRSE